MAGRAAKPAGRKRARTEQGQAVGPRPIGPVNSTDPADEWISLLTADSADELSGPGAEPARPGSRLPGPERPPRVARPGARHCPGATQPGDVP